MIALSITVLIAMFVASAFLPVNLGLLGLAGAFVVGVLAAGLSTKEVIAGFPGDLFVTLVGITYLFALAQRNGTIGLLVDGAAKALGGHASAVPPLVFVLAGLLTALGAPGPAAVAIIAPVALSFARQYHLSRLLMGLMAIHGAQAGAFSPGSIYGGITNQVLLRTGVPSDPGFLFVASLGFNAAIAVLVYAALRNRATSQPLPAASVEAPEPTGITREQALTLTGIIAMAAGALYFRLDIGFMAVCVIVLLALASPKSHKGGLDGVDWSTVLLITGVITYVGVMERVGTIDALGIAIGGISQPLLAALLICIMAGLVSAFASSTALLGVMIPLAQPLFGADAGAAILLVSAIAISTTIVDTSPFSTNGALVVANATPEGRDRLFRQLLGYTAAMVLIGPLVAWAVFVVLPG